MVSATEPSIEIEKQGFKARPPLEVTLSVWRALFLREALSRLTSTRSAALWLFLEPAFHVSYMLVLYTAIRVRIVGGIDAVVWLLVGVLAFLVFRRVAVQAGGAVEGNSALFTYRQVKPVDTVLVRAAVELMILVWVSAILFFGVALRGHNVAPADPLAIIFGVAGIWLLALGWGLVSSVLKELVPESGNILTMLMMPLYILSGTVFPISSVPYPYREWLLYNPLVHAIEGIRQGFSPYYHAPPETDISYLYGCALVLVFIGLALHRHFAVRLVSQ